MSTPPTASAGLHVYQDYESDVLKQVKVQEVMRRDVATLPASLTIRELADRIAKGDTETTLARGMPVVEAGSQSLICAFPDERAFDALFRMLQNNVGRLPVVERKSPWHDIFSVCAGTSRVPVV
jgi:chloride channel protein, CIC family